MNLVKAFKCILTLIFCLIFLLIFSSCNIILSPFSMFNTDEENNNENILYYVEEKSKFIDYDIEGDKIKFRYSIYFVNNTNETADFSISATFKEEELEGWIKIDDGIGRDEDGKMLNCKINKNFEGHVLFTFTGEYLGGKVNNDLSFPETLVILENYD